MEYAQIFDFLSFALFCLVAMVSIAVLVFVGLCLFALLRGFAQGLQTGSRAKKGVDELKKDVKIN